MGKNIWLGIREGLREIVSHRFRSFLTMLGIILGVAALMAMFALTAGVASGFRSMLIAFGGLGGVEIVDAAVPEEQEAIKDISPGRTYKDVLALRSSAPLVALVSPSLRLRNEVDLVRGNRSMRLGNVRGVEEPFLKVENYELAQGRMLSDLDQELRHRVIILGSAIKEELWGESTSDPVGETIRVDGHSFKVIGILKEHEANFKNKVCVIPLRTAQEIWFGVTMVNGVDAGPDLKLDRISVQLKDTNQFDQSIEQMRNVLNQTHRGIEDFGFNTKEDWAESVESGVRGIRISGGLIVGVTLIAGGVGITNIMLASIKERTREIGIRRAVGALPSNIFFQICLESIVLSIIAGLIGLVVGYGLIWGLEQVASEEQTPILEWSAVVYSFIAAVLTGFFAGVLPAWKASQLHPIEALKFE